MWAAEDFEVFKRLMTQKNIELQLQALQIIQQRHNVQMAVPTPYTSQGVPPPTAPGPAASAQVAMDEDAIMQEVLRRSKEEYELQQKDAKEKTADHDLEQSLALSKEESERYCVVSTKNILHSIMIATRMIVIIITFIMTMMTVMMMIMVMLMMTMIVWMVIDDDDNIDDDDSDYGD